MFYEWLANAILLIHAAFIAFVVVGLALVLIGGACGWRWVRGYWFRLAHLAAIALVVMQAWAGIRCPLTVWESALRRAGGEYGYPDGFIAYYVHQAIFYEAPLWVFTVAYTLFGLAVVISFWLVPPRRPWRRETITRRGPTS